MKKLTALMFVVALAGCATQPTEVVRGSSKSVQVRSASDEESLEYANRYCGKFGRIAIYKSELAPCSRCKVKDLFYDCVDD